MPQLDIYTFPTQIYSIALLFFFAFLFVNKFLWLAFFKIELLEKEEIYTLDTVFLLSLAKYTGPTASKNDVLKIISSALII